MPNWAGVSRWRGRRSRRRTSNTDWDLERRGRAAPQRDRPGPARARCVRSRSAGAGHPRGLAAGRDFSCTRRSNAGSNPSSSRRLRVQSLPWSMPLFTTEKHSKSANMSHTAARSSLPRPAKMYEGGMCAPSPPSDCDPAKERLRTAPDSSVDSGASLASPDPAESSSSGRTRRDLSLLLASLVCLVGSTLSEEWVDRGPDPSGRVSLSAFICLAGPGKVPGGSMQLPMYRAQYLALGIGTTMVRWALATALASEMLWAYNSGGHVVQ